MKVFERLVVGTFQCNCYLVGDPVSLQGIVIDPGDDPDAILAAAERHGLTLVAAVATHAHFDHVLAADAIRRKTGIPFYLHADDVPILARNQEAGRLFFGIELPPAPDVDRTYADGDELVAGSLRLGVIHTPGHSPGSVSLVAPDEAVFSGDTLFYASVGRTDLPGGDTGQELASIRERLFPLGDLPVFPGHGPPTTIGQEQVSNPFVGSSGGLWTPGN
jgi:glyoxylase-like metal-dependent hydrolase (beta-lactamase superfamily II)